MTVESNYTTVTATFSAWLKNLMLLLLTTEKQNQTNNLLHLVRMTFCHALSNLQVTVRNSDWCIMMFAPIVIGQSNYFGIGLMMVI